MIQLYQSPPLKTQRKVSEEGTERKFTPKDKVECREL